MHSKTFLVCVFATALIAGCGGNNLDNVDSRSPLAQSLASVTTVSGVATFSGPLANYSITKSDGGYVVKDSKGVDGTTTLPSVRSLVFSDVSVNLTIGATATTILSADLNRLIELYVAFFNRIPDADGLEYWTQRLQGGQTIEQIAETFYLAGVQNVALTGYSSTMTDSDFVRLIYKNVLGRSSVDAAGLEYWTSGLANGSKTRGALVKAILTAAHTFKGDSMYGSVADLLDNKIAVSLNFAVLQGLNFKSPAESIFKGMEIAAAITPTDVTAANAKINALLPTIFSPLANAGANQVVAVGSVVNLSGALSSTLNNDALSFSWTISALPVGSTAKLSSATVIAPTFKADLAGNYVFSLIVNDKKANSVAATTTVTAVVTTPTSIPDTGMYTCLNLTKSQALILYAQGHTYLDRDNDGKPCEANDISLTTTKPVPVVTVTPTVKQCYVNGYYRSNGTYVNGYYRSC